MSNIKAIETLYNGYRFRSRLEARWAVFFDTLGVEYKYEPEGFDLSDCDVAEYFGSDAAEQMLEGNSWYLPDFYLPGQGCWVEIKPTVDFGEQTYKSELLAVCAGRDVFVFMGDPYRGTARYLWITKYGVPLLSEYPIFKPSAFTDRSFIEFMGAHYPSETYSKLSPEYAPPKDDYARHVFEAAGGNPTILNAYGMTLIKAYEAARRARFGKNGRG